MVLCCLCSLVVSQFSLSVPDERDGPPSPRTAHQQLPVVRVQHHAAVPEIGTVPGQTDDLPERDRRHLEDSVHQPQPEGHQSARATVGASPQHARSELRGCWVG